jgi:hypothetical protein
VTGPVVQIVRCYTPDRIAIAAALRRVLRAPPSVTPVVPPEKAGSPASELPPAPLEAAS